MPRAPKKPPTKPSSGSMLDQLLRELQQKTSLQEGAKKRRITKGQALVKSMVNEALDGDQKMLAAVLKLAEKLDTLQAQKTSMKPPVSSLTTAAQWHILFAFYARYKGLIEAQIEQFKADDPHYWGFEWASEPSPGDAPWHADLHSET